MKAEIRADGLHISGYVNATEKKSRPVITGKGQKVIEIIEPRAFEKALEKAENVVMTKDHNENYVLAETRSGNLELFEDAIGLHADVTITDEPTIDEARAGKLKGWSFGMRNISDEIEERADELPLRKVKGFDLDHITLVVNQTPCYAATSIEMRADEISELESRSSEEEIKIEEEKAKVEFDNSSYRERLQKIKAE